jgi:hypothetical protein
MQSNNGIPFISDFKSAPDINWQMSRAEKYCLINLLQHLKPETAIEIGTFMGGSLQVLNELVQNIYSIDISPAPKSYLEKQFSKVDFRVGNSHELIPNLIREIEEKGQRLEFILVDGDHTTKAVKRDLEAILNYNHKQPITIILHDSFNPQCRKGIKSVDYSLYHQVSYVELDYIGGSYWHNDTYREMWGGFAMIQINPNHKGRVSIQASLEKMYRRTYWGSVHIFKDSLQFLVPLKQKIFRKLGLKQRINMYEKFD